MRRILPLSLSLLPALLLSGDGYHVEKWLTHAELTATSRCIFTATVVKTAHIHAVREAYGRRTRYVSRYRLLVRIDRVLKGDPLPDEGRQKPCWLEQGGRFIPGKWLLLAEAYRNGIDPGQAKKGDRILVYAHSRNGQTCQLRGLDPVTMAAATEALLKRNQ